MLPTKHTGSGEHRARDDLTPITERKTFVSAFDRDLSHLHRRQKLRAEPLGLCHGAACQFAAADAGRKPEVVLYPRTRTCLTTRGPPVEQQRSQAFRCAVHRPRQTGGTGAHDDQVVHVEGGRQRPAQALGYLPGFRVAQHGTSILEKQRRKLVIRHARGIQKRACARFSSDVHPVIGNEIARQKILDRMGSRRPLVSHESETLRFGEVLRLPRVEEVIHNWEEKFLRRLPGLRQIVIDMRFVDRFDSRVNIGVGG